MNITKLLYSPSATAVGTIIKIRGWLLTSCLCMVIMSLSAQVFATQLATDSASSSTDSAESNVFDMSKVPPVTPMPRPGLFGIGPSGPGYYSVWDMLTGKKREKPPHSPYARFALLPTSAFDIDFRYLDTPDYEPDFFDPVKRIHLGNDWLLSFGGSFWYRHVRETDSRLNATGTNNSFNLIRTRIHADLWYRDQVRLFAEFIDARSFSPDLAPLATDRNHTDMLNLFADIKLANTKDGHAYLRVGRQELLYGSQRLIAPLDWANTRRTFQGVKTFWRTSKFDVDAFWVRPMDTEKGNFDNWDTQRNFFGLWGTYKPKKGHLADFYYLSLDDNRNVSAANVAQGNIMRGDSIVHTLGSRLIGNFNRFLYEIEGMYQFGERSNLNVSAFAVAHRRGLQLCATHESECLDSI